MFKKIINKLKCYLGTHEVDTLRMMKGKVTRSFRGSVWKEDCIVSKYKCVRCGKTFCLGEVSTGASFPVSVSWFNTYER